MLIHVGGRTDITHYYSEWLLNRIREGYALSRNPLFPHRVTRYVLDPALVDCILFCTKNPVPIMDKLEEIRARGFRMFFYVTITGYGKDIEPRVPGIRETARAFRELSRAVGVRNICWRYDPIFITPRYTVEHHLECFDALAGELAPFTGFCVFSFVELYKKLRATFPELRAVSEDEKRLLLHGMGRIAARRGLRLQTCGDGGDYARFGIHASGCMTAPILEKAIGQELKAVKPRPTRKGCGCIPVNDIGAYDTCPSGCRYCYATKNPRLALANHKNHDPHSPLLIGGIRPGDTITDARQVSFRRPGARQFSLL